MRPNDFPMAEMTAADYFAAAALTGRISLEDLDETTEKSALWAYKYADAMLAERSKNLREE